MTHRYVFDYQDGDIYACVADIGWITGHSYVVYGPLCNGATTVLFESVPTYPDAGRYWEMVERLGVTQFYTAPTAIRAIAREGDKFVKPYDLLLPARAGHRGRAHQPRGLALVLQRRRRGPLPDRGHLVADRDRRHPHHARCPGPPRSSPASATLPFFGDRAGGAG